MKAASATIRERLVGQPLIGFETTTVSTPRAKVGNSLPETAKAPRAKVGSSLPEITPGA